MSMMHILATGLITSPETLNQEQPAAMLEPLDPLPQVVAPSNHLSLNQQGDRHKGIGLVEFSGTAAPESVGHIEAALTAIASGSWHDYMRRKRIEKSAKDSLERENLERLRMDKALREKQRAEGNVTFAMLQAHINAVMLSRTE